MGVFMTRFGAALLVTSLLASVPALAQQQQQQQPAKPAPSKPAPSQPAKPAAPAAPAPALEPPGVRSTFQGLRARAWKLDRPDESMP